MAKYVIINEDNGEYLKRFNNDDGEPTADWGEIDYCDVFDEIPTDAVVFEDAQEAERVAEMLNEAIGEDDDDDFYEECQVQKVELVSKYRYVEE